MLGKLHWIIYAHAAISLIVLTCSLMVVIVGFGYSPSEESSGLALLLVGAAALAAMVSFAAAIILAIAAWFDQWTTEIAVTDRRVIYKRGFIQRHTAEMNMDKIESVIVDQSILGRILGFGSIHVLGTGEGLEHLHKVSSPVELRNCITAR